MDYMTTIGDDLRWLIRFDTAALLDRFVLVREGRLSEKAFSHGLGVSSVVCLMAKLAFWVSR